MPSLADTRYAYAKRLAELYGFPVGSYADMWNSFLWNSFLARTYQGSLIDKEYQYYKSIIPGITGSIQDIKCSVFGTTGGEIPFIQSRMDYLALVGAELITSTRTGTWAEPLLSNLKANDTWNLYVKGTGINRVSLSTGVTVVAAVGKTNDDANLFAHQTAGPPVLIAKNAVPTNLLVVGSYSAGTVTATSPEATNSAVVPDTNSLGISTIIATAGITKFRLFRGVSHTVDVQRALLSGM